MNEYFGGFKAVAATVRSSSGAVTVRQESLGGPKVEIDTAKMAGHDELTLAEEIEYAVLEARESHSDKLRGPTNARGTKPEASEGNVIAQLLSELGPEIASFEGLGVSEHGHVQASSYGDGDLVIHFRNNAVRRTDIDNKTLEPQVNEAISRSIHALREQIRECYRQRVTDAKS